MLLHENDIIHRDIKPANLLINDECQVSICDFGLARKIPQSESEKHYLNVLKESYFQNVLEQQKIESKEEKGAFSQKAREDLST